MEIFIAIGMLLVYFQRANRQMIESTEKYRLIVENQNDLIVKLNSRQQIVYASPSYCITFGKTEKELLGFDFKPLIHPEDAHQVRASLASLSEKPHTTYHEERAMTVNGWRYLAWSARAVINDNGEIKEIISVGRDITDQKQAENALRDSEAYMKSIFRAAPTGIGVVHNRIFRKVNDKFCEMLGYSGNELLGQSARIVYPSDEAYETVGFEKYKQIGSKGSGTVETVMKCKDGKTIDVLLSSTPIDNKNPELGVSFTALDITGIKLAEEALKKSELKYRTMMEAIKDPVYICSQNHRIKYMNPAMIQRIGYDATGKKCFNALHGFNDKCPWCVHKNIFEMGHTELDITSPKDYKSYNVVSSVFTDEDGSFSKICVFRDTTEFKKLQSQLQEAQKMEAIGNLAGGIAHDFNNILYPIVGMAELLLEDLPLDSPEYENAEEILNAGLRGSDLVKQILAFSRKAEHKKIPVRVQQILKEVLKLGRSTIPSNIEIIRDIQSDCGLIAADPTQLHQIAMNLITNAYHAVENSSGTIFVKLREIRIENNDKVSDLLNPGPYAKLTISDTGCGMDSAIMDKIFEPYFTTKKQGKGTGLGLAVVYGIVREHGGDIRVKSEIGKGAQFDVYFPIMEKETQLQEITPPPTYESGTEKILLVDDEEAIVRLEKEILSRLGYRVEERYSSTDALQAFKADPNSFDLVITDMTMPNMTGDQFAEKLISIRPDIPVIICTGFSERMNKEKAKEMGIRGFLLKPVVKSEMARLIRDVLAGAKI